MGFKLSIVTFTKMSLTPESLPARQLQSIRNAKEILAWLSDQKDQSVQQQSQRLLHSPAPEKRHSSDAAASGAAQG